MTQYCSTAEAGPAYVTTSGRHSPDVVTYADVLWSVQMSIHLKVRYTANLVLCAKDEQQSLLWLLTVCAAKGRAVLKVVGPHFQLSNFPVSGS